MLKVNDRNRGETSQCPIKSLHFTWRYSSVEMSKLAPLSDTGFIIQNTENKPDIIMSPAY